MFGTLGKNLLLFIVLLTSSSFLLADEAEVRERIYKGTVYSLLGYEEDNNMYFFNKGVKVLEEARELAISKGMPTELINELDDKLKDTESRKKAFSYHFRNHFPLLPFLAKDYDHYDDYKKSNHLAIEMAMGELKAVTDGISGRKGQSPVIVLADRAEDLNYVTFLMQGSEPFAPYTSEELVDILGEALTYEQLAADPAILLPLMEAEGFPFVLVFYLERVGTIDDFEHYIGYTFILRKDNPQTLVTTAMSDGFGKSLYSFSENFEILAVSLACFLLIILPLNLYWTFKRKSKSYEKKGLKQALLGVVMLVTGALFGITVEFLPDYFFENTTPVGFSKYIITIVGFSIAIFGAAIALLILFRIEGSFSLTNHKFYLPVLLCYFFTGIAYWLLIEQYYFNLIYQEQTTYYKLLAIAVFVPMLGFIAGIAFRRFIDSRDRGGVRRFVSSFYLVVVAVLFGLGYSYYLQNQTVQLFYFSLVSLGVLFVGEFTDKKFTKKKQSVTQNDVGQQSTLPPETLPELQSILNKPVFTPMSPGFNEFGDLVDKAVNEEGGVVIVSGDKGCGKSRYIEEFFRQSQIYSQARIVNMECKDPSLEEVPPFQPFIDGLLELDEIKAIREAQKLNKFVQENTGKLQAPAENIPFVGWIISALISTDTSGLVSKSDRLETIKQISESILTFSQTLLGEASTGTGCMIFVIDHSQFLDEASIELIRAIQNILRDEEKSPEENPLAFVLISDTEFQIRNERAVHPRIGEAHYFEVKGFNYEQGLDFFQNSLNFSRSSQRLYDFIFRQISVENDFISPRYMIEYIRRVAVADSSSADDLLNSYLARTPRGFKIRDEIDFLQIPLPEHIAKNQDQVFSVLTDQEHDLLECAAVIGIEFSAAVLEEVLYPGKRLEVLQLCQRIIEKTGFICDLGKDDLFQFVHPYTRNTIIQRLLIQSGQGSSLADKQIYVYFNKVILSVKEKLEIGTAKEHADHAIHGGEELKGKAIEKILHYFEEEGYNSPDAVRLYNQLISYTYSANGGMKKGVLPNYFDELILSAAQILQIHRSVQEPSSKKFLAELPLLLKTEEIQSTAVALALYEINFLLPKDLKKNWEEGLASKFDNILMGLSPSISELNSKRFWEATSLKGDQPEKALAIFQSMQSELAGNQDELDLYSRALTGLVEIYHRKKMYAEAEETLSQALAAKEELSDAQGLAILYSSASNICLATDRIQESLEMIEKALFYNKEIQSDFGIKLSLGNKGQLLFLDGQLVKAADAFRDALNFTDDPHDRFEFLGNAAVLAKRANEPNLENSYRQSLARAIKRNNEMMPSIIEKLTEKAHTHAGLGVLFKERNDYIKALVTGIKS